MVSFYPLTFRPIYKPKIWGGNRFATLFDRDLPPGMRIGESWEICDRRDASSVVTHGDFAGVTLAELRERHPVELFGEIADECRERFPLLLKFIDAEEQLSLQVHPENRYALRRENDLGKNEAWFVVEAMPGAKLVRGFRAGTTREKVERALQQSKVTSLAYSFDVDKGDSVMVPAGALHAIGSGLVVAEVSQNSDVTYRVHDYGRTGHNGSARELHIDRALDVITYRDLGSPKLKPVKIEPLHYRLAVCDNFSMYYYDFREPIHEYSIKRFRILSNLEGYGTIISPEGLFEDVDFHPGTSILVPASVKDYSIVPATHCVMLDIIPGKILLRRRKS